MLFCVLELFTELVVLSFFTSRQAVGLVAMRPSPSWQGLRVPGDYPAGAYMPGYPVQHIYGMGMPGAPPPLFSPYNVPPEEEFTEAIEHMRNKPKPPDLNRPPPGKYVFGQHYKATSKAEQKGKKPKLTPHWSTDTDPRLSHRVLPDEHDRHDMYVTGRGGYSTASPRKTGMAVMPTRKDYDAFAEGRYSSAHSHSHHMGESRHH